MGGDFLLILFKKIHVEGNNLSLKIFNDGFQLSFTQIRDDPPIRLLRVAGF